MDPIHIVGVFALRLKLSSWSSCYNMLEGLNFQNNSSLASFVVPIGLCTLKKKRWMNLKLHQKTYKSLHENYFVDSCFYFISFDTLDGFVKTKPTPNFKFLQNSFINIASFMNFLLCCCTRSTYIFVLWTMRINFYDFLYTLNWTWCSYNRSCTRINDVLLFCGSESIWHGLLENRLNC